jgi:energy-coupling factor transporter transmembrane protein EcfT
LIGTSDTPAPLFKSAGQPKIGTVGHLAVFVWVLGLVMLVPQTWLPFSAIPCLAVLIFIFPGCLTRTFRLRWLVLLILLASPSVFLFGELDRSLVGIAYSSTGLAVGLQIGVRFIVVLVAVGGLTENVDITSIAGLLERLGLQGLGFSVGVALNLLPSLQASSVNAWRSLWMRGGLRRNRLRGLRLLVLTIITNALRRADEITLAAETRAFTPESSRPAPVVLGSWDVPTLVLVVVSWAAVLMLR